LSQLHFSARDFYRMYNCIWLFTKAHGTLFARLYSYTYNFDTFYTDHVPLGKNFALVNLFQTPPQTKTPVKTTFRDWCLYSSFVHGYSY
jgi:hypothetical protein